MTIEPEIADALRVTHYVGVAAGRALPARKESTWLDGSWSKPTTLHHPKRVIVAEPGFKNLEAFARHLREVVYGDSEIALCMSQPTEERRALYRKGVEGERKGGFDPTAPKHVIPFDLDNVPFPAKYDLFEDTQLILEWIRDTAFPPEFRDQSMIAVMTSSCGLADVTRISARLFFWAAEPRSPAEMRRYVKGRLNPAAHNVAEWANTKRVVDTSIYNRGQPIYVMRPKLIGAPDPWANRVLYIEGMDDGLTVEVPDEDYVPEFGDTPYERTGEVYTGPVWRLVEHIGAVNRREIMLRMSWLLANRTPEGRVEGTILRLAAEIRKTIPDADPSIDEKVLKSVREAFAGARKIVRGRTETKGKAPERHVLEVSRGNLEDQLGAAVRRAIAGEPVRHSLALVDVGGGKTTAVLKALKPEVLRDNLVHFLAPDHRLAANVVEDYRELHGDALVFHHKGRAELCESEHWGAVAALAESVGRSPYKVACQKCPLHDSCQWVAQRQYEGNGLIVMPHAHIGTTYNNLHDRKTGVVSDAAPRLVIVDESPLATFLRSDGTQRKLSTLEVRDLELISATYDGDPKLLGPLLADGRRQLVEIIGHRNHTLAVAEFEAMDELWLSRLRAFEADLRRALHKALDKALDDGNTSLVGRLAGVLAASEWVETAYRAISTSRRLGRKAVFGLLARDGAAQAFLRSPLPPVLRQRHTIWLDATGDESVMRRIVGPEIPLDVVRAAIHPGNYRLVAYPDRTFSKSDLLRVETRKERAAEERRRHGDPTADAEVARGEQRKRRADSNIARLHAMILRLNAKMRLERRQAVVDVLSAAGEPTGATKLARTLVVAQKPVREALEALGLPDDVVVGHYNAIRGQNWFKRLPAYVVVGRPWQGFEAAERAYEALVFDDPSVMSYTQALRPEPIKRAQEMADGTWVEVSGEGHPDAGVHTIFEGTAAAEVKQAIGRARIVSRKDKPVLVMLGQCDPGVPVHELKHWVDQERDLAELQGELGIAIQNPEVFGMAFPGVVSVTVKHDSTSERALRTAFTRLQTASSGFSGYIGNICARVSGSTRNSKDTLKCDNVAQKSHLKMFTVQLGVKRGRQYVKSRILVDVQRHPDPRTAVEDLLGQKVAVFAAVPVARKDQSDKALDVVRESV